MSSGQHWAAERDEDERIARKLENMRNPPVPDTSRLSLLSRLLVVGSEGLTEGHRLRLLENLIQEAQLEERQSVARKLTTFLMGSIR